MKSILSTLAIGSILACATGFAEEAVLERPSFSASQTVVISATVEAIDHETRLVTLRDDAGEEITITASDEVRNLAQVSVGDVLLAEYVEMISVDVIADNGMGAGAAEAGALAKADEGEMPGFVAMDKQVVVAVVEEINIEANTFKLKSADGSINEYTARDPQNLKRAMVGDLVVTTVTTAVAMTVEKQAAE